MIVKLFWHKKCIKMTVLVYSQLSAQKFFINCINLQLCQGGWSEEKVETGWGR